MRGVEHLTAHAEPPIGSRRRSHAHRLAVAMAGEMIERSLGAVPLSADAVHDLNPFGPTRPAAFTNQSNRRPGSSGQAAIHRARVVRLRSRNHTGG